MAALADIKEGLKVTLETIQSSASFLTGRDSVGLAMPGLDVPGVGNIRLPISADDAKAIAQCCDRSRSADESVRRTWQLDPGQFSLQNPNWQQQISALVVQAMTRLGLTAHSDEVTAELYKLLINEEGAFFRQHHDSEKADGMFATLVVYLPSKYDGGDLVASHRGSKIVRRTAPYSEFSSSWFAWYADVNPEVKPVTSGYRVALVYDLIHRPSVGLGVSSVQEYKLVRLLECWESRLDGNDSLNYSAWDGRVDEYCPPGLVYALENQYTKLHFDRLKGVDQARLAELQKASRRLGFDIYLANFEKPKSKNSNPKFSRVMDALGVDVAKHLPFHESMLIQEGLLSNRDPNLRKYGDFTGNAGTHSFRATGTIIIPKGLRLLFTLHRLRHRAGNIADLLKECRCLALERPNDEVAKRKLLQACNNVIDRGDRSDDVTDHLMQIAVEFDDVVLFPRVIKWLNTKMRPSHLHHIAGFMAKHEFQCLRSELERILQNRISGRKPGFREKYIWLSNLIREYRAMCEKQGRGPSFEVLTWESTTVNRFLSALLKDPESGGHELAKSLTSLPKEDSFEKLMALLETKLEHTALLASFFTSAMDHLIDGRLDKKAVVAVLKKLVPKCINTFHIEYKTNYPHPVKYKPLRISSRFVINMIRLADLTDIGNSGIANTLTEYALNLEDGSAASAFSGLLFPVAIGLCKHIDNTARSSSNGERQFVKQMLTKCLTDFVKPAPIVPSDWKAKTTIQCTCDDCAMLREFIQDSSVTTECFPIPEPRRTHLELQLDRSYFTTSIIKSGSPYMLEVEKTRAMLVSQLYEWNRRSQNVKPQLNKLYEYVSLKEMLGDSYDFFREHPNLELPDGHPAIGCLPKENDAEIPQSLVPSKRRHSG
ncbi:hypothetical protein ASPBRDRAFT_659851 [Aspergillus brasiliensis CBS 101740]|uniref:Prolyl 4-hydroxylase alpha subunit Fe(2+) 2OG dioxygenase domain-containing protein n=1 Tax=Aspergillus brasiliensis (strain CBS 101740 / IMI 381727 / IBT 21946) TaxID=767769 RepID=A0A1L9U9M6_ASPBC|nr:hypothetical protein ASPBRDRAFT_659851 [Aspergillus brasiliensis CBS 101740]